MKILNVFGGIGSMAEAARQLGHEVMGNIEPREFFNDRTWQANFPGTLFSSSLSTKHPEDPDIIVGHPSCGEFSTMRIKATAKKTVTDIPDFCTQVERYRPKAFIMDNLKGALKVFKAPHGYTVKVHTISAQDVGNLQNRRRIFFIGIREDLVPMEDLRIYPIDVVDTEYPWQAPFPMDGTHLKHSKIVNCPPYKQVFDRVNGGNWKDFAVAFRDIPEMQALEYVAADGETKTKRGCRKIAQKRPFPTITGTNLLIDPTTCYPLSPRQRMRIMGLPDTFKLPDLKIESDGTWAFSRNHKVIAQIGKAVPVQVTKFLLQNVVDHLNSSRPAMVFVSSFQLKGAKDDEDI